MATDTTTSALARMVRTRLKRLERDVKELRQLAAQLADTVDDPDTSEEDTDGDRPESRDPVRGRRAACRRHRARAGTAVFA